jgi:hypothetical protein
MKTFNLAILAFAIACSEASTSPDSREPDATYTLQSIDGAGLPYESRSVWSCLPGPFGCVGPHVIRSLVITVKADGTWTGAYDWSRWTFLNGGETYMSTPDGSMTGVWSRWDANLIFRSDSLEDAYFLGTVDGSTLTLERNFVLARRSPP